MKVALIYTSTTPELIELVEREVKNNIGDSVDILSYQDSAILNEVREAGYVTPTAGAKLIAMYTEAIKEGADAILNICSSVGEVADSMQAAAAYLGVPIVRIDEEMCQEAVRRGSRIGILATLPTTLAPTRNTVVRVARELGRQVEIVEGLVDNAFGLDTDSFRKRLLDQASQIKDMVDVIVLAQGSMAYVEEYIYKELGIVTLSSPKFGAIELKKALDKKGM